VLLMCTYIPSIPLFLVDYFYNWSLNQPAPRARVVFVRAACHVGPPSKRPIKHHLCPNRPSRCAFRTEREGQALLSLPHATAFGSLESAGCLGFRLAAKVWSERYRCSVNPGQYTAGQNPGRLLRWFDPRSAHALHAVNPFW